MARYQLIKKEINPDAIKPCSESYADLIDKIRQGCASSGFKEKFLARFSLEDEYEDLEEFIEEFIGVIDEILYCDYAFQCSSFLEDGAFLHYDVVLEDGESHWLEICLDGEEVVYLSDMDDELAWKIIYENRKKIIEDLDQNVELLCSVLLSGVLNEYKEEVKAQLAGAKKVRAVLELDTEKLLPLFAYDEESLKRLFENHKVIEGTPEEVVERVFDVFEDWVRYEFEDWGKEVAFIKFPHFDGEGIEGLEEGTDIEIGDYAVKFTVAIRDEYLRNTYHGSITYKFEIIE